MAVTPAAVIPPMPPEGTYALDPPHTATPKRIAFHGTAAVKRGDFGMTRELLDEIGATSDSADVWIRIDAELLATARTSP